MKPILLILLVLATSILWPADLTWGVCPQDPNDDGLCDTMYVELYSGDADFTGPGQLVRVPIYVTHDIPNPILDSLAGMLIPFCYTHTNPTKFCSLSAYWNTLAFSGAGLSRSIFRDLDGTQNHFLDMYAGVFNPGSDFNLNVSTPNQHFWFGWSGTMAESPRWGEGSQLLALTITFRVQDTMTVCIDSCFWPPSDRLAFARSDAVLYIPRHNLPYCFSIFFKVGDVTRDGRVDVGDVVFLIGYLYKDAPAPNPLSLGDANCDGIVDIGDVIFLINYLFKGGPAPAC